MNSNGAICVDILKDGEAELCLFTCIEKDVIERTFKDHGFSGISARCESPIPDQEKEKCVADRKAILTSRCGQWMIRREPGPGCMELAQLICGSIQMSSRDGSNWKCGAI